jgi:hypothetical protein
MKHCVRDWSSRGWLLITLVAILNLVACGDDTAEDSAPIGVDGVGNRPDAAAPMPGLGMMTEMRDAAFSEPDAAQPRDAAQAPAVSDAGAPKLDASSDALDAASAPSDSGAAADAGGDAASSNEGGMSTDSSSVCAGGKVGMDSKNTTLRDMTSSRNLAVTIYTVKPPNRIVNFKTTMLVPKTPAQRSTLFIWPGLQHSGGADPGRIGNGVLQPVLTWGSSCSRQASSNYTNWGIAGMYVNISSGAAGPGGCASGDGMQAVPGERLLTELSLHGTAWTQTITNLGNLKKVDFTFDLKGQDQNMAIWDIETPASSRPAEDTIFEKSVVTMAEPVTSCQPSIGAKVDYFSAPVLSPDGLHCCFDQIILKQQRN